MSWNTQINIFVGRLDDAMARFLKLDRHHSRILVSRRIRTGQATLFQDPRWMLHYDQNEDFSNCVADAALWSVGSSKVRRRKLRSKN